MFEIVQMKTSHVETECPADLHFSREFTTVRVQMARLLRFVAVFYTVHMERQIDKLTRCMIQKGACMHTFILEDKIYAVL